MPQDANNTQTSSATKNWTGGRSWRTISQAPSHLIGVMMCAEGASLVVMCPGASSDHSTDDHGSAPHALEYAEPPIAWWRRRKRLLFLLGLFLLLMAVAALAQRLGLKAGDLLWDARNSL